MYDAYPTLHRTLFIFDIYQTRTTTTMEILHLVYLLPASSVILAYTATTVKFGHYNGKNVIVAPPQPCPCSFALTRKRRLSRAFPLSVTQGSKCKAGQLQMGILLVLTFTTLAHVISASFQIALALNPGMKSPPEMPAILPWGTRPPKNSDQEQASGTYTPFMLAQRISPCPSFPTRTLRRHLPYQ